MSSMLFFLHRFYGQATITETWNSVAFLFMALGVMDLVRVLEWNFSFHWQPFLNVVSRNIPLARVVSNSAGTTTSDTPTTSTILNAIPAEHDRVTKLLHNGILAIGTVIGFLTPAFVLIAAMEQDYFIYFLSLFRLATISSPFSLIRRLQTWWTKSELTVFTTVVGVCAIFAALRPTVISLDKYLTVSYLRTFDWKSRQRAL